MSVTRAPLDLRRRNLLLAAGLGLFSLGIYLGFVLLRWWAG